MYNKKVETLNCDIHSGVPKDNPSDCTNPEDKCQTSIISLGTFLREKITRKLNIYLPK